MKRKLINLFLSMEKGKMITAKKLKSMGMSISDIHKATGLTADTIENL